MVARWQMNEAFGEDVIHLDHDLAGELGVPPVDRGILAYVGLPKRVGVFFTTETTGVSELFSVTEFDFPSGRKEALSLGGPPGDERMRFLLDLHEGYVVLVSFQGDRPQAEIVNSGLDEFIEFLCRFAVRDKDLRQVSVEEAREYDQGFIEVLKEIDPLAFSQPDSWWSMVTDQIRSRGETR
ncbi:SUKH-4 family immunity protein [Streptomyces sp. NPDC002156]